MKIMRKNVNIVSFFVGGLLLLSGCYDDKGSYDYHDINEISIELPTSVSVRLSKEKPVVAVIEPKLSQTLAEEESNLTYRWEEKLKKTGALDEWIECGQEKTCELVFQPTDVNIRTVRLVVTDHRKDGSEWYQEMTVKPIVPYSRSWFVLQQVDGKSVLGVVDGEGNGGGVVRDAYKSDMKQDLPIEGTPKFLLTDWSYGTWDEYYTRQQPVIFVGTDRDVHLMNAVSFEQIYTYQEMLHIKEVTGDNNFSPDWLVSFTSSRLGEIVSDNGKLYAAAADGLSVYYPLVWEDGHEESCNVTKIASMTTYGFIFYDEQNHRFLRCKQYYNEGDSDYNYYFRKGREQYFFPAKVIRNIVEIGANPYAGNAFDPNDLGNDKIMIDMNRVDMNVLATLFSTSDHKLHVYDFDGSGFGASSTAARCAGKYTFDVPGGMNVDEMSIATSYAFGKMLFIAGGNKIYKVDLNRTVPRVTLLYEHENAFAKITGLKFRNSNTDWGYRNDEGNWEWIGAPYRLGISLDYGGNEGGILELKLASTGEVERDSEVFEYKGFGKIIDFGYSVKL